MSVTAEEHVRVRAYHLWEANGRPEGRDLEFWEQARQSLANGELLEAQQPPMTARPITDLQSAVALKGASNGADRQPARRRGRKS